MSTAPAREIEISTLHGLIDLHQTEEKRLRRQIIETESGALRQELIRDLQLVLRQIQTRSEELQRLKNSPPGSRPQNESHPTHEILEVSWE